jgi:hypothetical protein
LKVSLSYKEYDHALFIARFAVGAWHRRIGVFVSPRSTPDRVQSLVILQIKSIDDDLSVGRMMRDMRAELGEEMPPEFDEVVDRLTMVIFRNR